jgi:hypothetical protein
MLLHTFFCVGHFIAYNNSHADCLGGTPLFIFIEIDVDYVIRRALLVAAR